MITESRCDVEKSHKRVRISSTQVLTDWSEQFSRLKTMNQSLRTQKATLLVKVPFAMRCFHRSLMHSTNVTCSSHFLFINASMATNLFWLIRFVLSLPDY